MRTKDVLPLFGSWSHKYKKQVDAPITIDFLTDLTIGQGFLKHNINDKYQIGVGIAPLSKSIFHRYQQVDNLLFTKIGVTFFHEIGHFEQASKKNTAYDILINDLSKVGNIQYYEENWPRLLHEIDAEYTGVISMWSKLENMNSKTSDEFMTSYLEYKSVNTKYIIQKPENGFESKEQVDQLFETAYDHAMISKRTLSAAFLRSEDEIAQLFTNKDRVIRQDYNPFYQQIQHASSGTEMDRKMASLVSYLHPELQTLYPKLDFNQLNPETVFGIPMPETQEEIKERIQMQAEDGLLSNDYDFVQAVAEIPDDPLSDVDDFTKEVIRISENNSSQQL